jgi:hypothetical protein
MLPRNEQSPPDRKRLRRSPLGSEQGPPMGMNYPQPGQPQGGSQQGGPQQLPNGMMRPMGAPGMNGFPPGGGMPNMGNNPGMNVQPQMGGQPMLGQPMGGPQMTQHGMTAAQQHQQVSIYLNSNHNQPCSDALFGLDATIPTRTAVPTIHAGFA